MLKYFRFNYHILWEDRDQPAFKYIPQTLTHTELLPLIIHDKHKHPFYRDSTKLHILQTEAISYDANFAVEHSEASDNRPYLFFDTHTDNTYYDYDTTSQSEQIETLHDPPEPLNDTHRTAHELLEPT